MKGGLRCTFLSMALFEMVKARLRKNHAPRKNSFERGVGARSNADVGRLCASRCCSAFRSLPYNSMSLVSALDLGVVYCWFSSLSVLLDRIE